MNLDSAIFYSNDIDKVVNFYKNVVGLELDYQDGDHYASFLFPNGVSLGIKKSSNEREKPGSQTIIISTQDAESIYKNFVKLKVTMYKILREESWGLTFSILDPDNNKVEFLKKL